MALLVAPLRPMMVSFCIFYGVLLSRSTCRGTVPDAAFEKPSCRCLGTESVAGSPASSWTYHCGRVDGVSVHVCVRSSWPQPLFFCQNLSVCLDYCSASEVLKWSLPGRGDSATPLRHLCCSAARRDTADFANFPSSDSPLNAYRQRTFSMCDRVSRYGVSILMQRQ